MKSPITVQGHVAKCWLSTYSMPAELAAAYLPFPLEPVRANGRAFWNIVVCELRHMRPSGFPAAFGIGYRHAAYRLYARFRDTEGLFFVRSDADSPLVACLGNLLTDYRFQSSKVLIEEDEDGVELRIENAEAPGKAVIDYRRRAELSPNSAFTSLQEATDFLKYQPAGLSVHNGQVSAVRISRDEMAWNSHLVHVADFDWSILRDLPLTQEVCYQIEPIDYRWNRAQTLV